MGICKHNNQACEIVEHVKKNLTRKL